MEQALLGEGAASNRILLPTQGCSRADLPGPDSALFPGGAACGWAGLAQLGGWGWLSWVGRALALALRLPDIAQLLCLPFVGGRRMGV